MWRVSFGLGWSFPGWQRSTLIDSWGWTGRHSCTQWHCWWPFKQVQRFLTATIGTFLENVTGAGLAKTTVPIHLSFQTAVASHRRPARRLPGIMARSRTVLVTPKKKLPGPRNRMVSATPLKGANPRSRMVLATRKVIRFGKPATGQWTAIF